MTPLINEGPISEHAGYPSGLPVDRYEGAYALKNWKSLFFKGDPDKCCILFRQQWGGARTMQSSYYVGADWIEAGKLAVYVEPKLNDKAKETDYFKMLFEGFQNPDIAAHLPNIFELKTDALLITIPSSRDILTPLLVVQYLNVLKGLVRKGLKKTHQSTEQNLSGRIKGKLMVSQHLHQNVFRNKVLDNHCRFNQFTVDGPENRVLKKALQFVVRYINGGELREYRREFEKLLNYIQPAFTGVSDVAAAEDLRQFKVSAFFKDYQQAIRLARLIFKRYGFNITSVHSAGEVVTVPPFWVDMSKLYELYVLAQLRRQEYGRDIRFQPSGRYGAPDFILTREKHPMIMDAKYKPYYSDEYVAADIRQLSGYARDEGILKALNLADAPEKSTVTDCLIIYPVKEAGAGNSLTLTDLKNNEIDQFYRFYKVAVELPFKTIPR